MALFYAARYASWLLPNSQFARSLPVADQILRKAWPSSISSCWSLSGATKRWSPVTYCAQRMLSTLHSSKKITTAAAESLPRPVSTELDQAPSVLVYESIHRFEPLYFASASRALLLAPFRPDVIHRVVLYQRAGRRCGSAHTKTRAEVSGSGRKPWPQKGTGRARAGSLRAPHFRGGGVAHGPRNTRIWAQKLPKKVRRLGLASALSRRYQEGRLWVLDHWWRQQQQEQPAGVSEAGSQSPQQVTGIDENLRSPPGETDATAMRDRQQTQVVSVRDLTHFLNERGWRAALFIGSARFQNSPLENHNWSSIPDFGCADDDFQDAKHLWEEMRQRGDDDGAEWEQLERAAGNLRADVLLRTSLSVGVYDIVRYPRVLITLNALRELELRIRGQSRVLVNALRLGPLFDTVTLVRQPLGNLEEKR